MNLRHSQIRVIVNEVKAVLGGASGPIAIAKWAALNEERFLGTLSLPNGIRRKDVYRRVLVALKPGALSSLSCRLAAYATCRYWRGDRRRAIDGGFSVKAFVGLLPLILFTGAEVAMGRADADQFEPVCVLMRLKLEQKRGPFDHGGCRPRQP